MKEDTFTSIHIEEYDVEIRENCPNQTAYIIIDQSTGERTVLWSRPNCLRLEAESITLEKIAGGYLKRNSNMKTLAGGQDRQRYKTA